VLDGDAVDIVEEHRAESGEEVAVLDGDLSTVIVYL
jgi:valyl-tRNA synthetase